MDYLPLTGIGYDVHRFTADKKLILGGVEIPHDMGLDGHSDADVIIHALSDAILGAIGERDIGFHFPPGIEETKNINSMLILQKAIELVNERKARLINVDIMVMAESPKLGDYLQEMKSKISEVLAVNDKWIGIKATTNEKMGFVGREEGIACMATCSLVIPTGHYE